MNSLSLGLNFIDLVGLAAALVVSAQMMGQLFGSRSVKILIENRSKRSLLGQEIYRHK